MEPHEKATMAELESTARAASPEPTAEADKTRKRTTVSRSPSPPRVPPALRRRSRSHSPPRHNVRLPRDVDRSRAEERARQFAVRQREEQSSDIKPLTAEEKQASAKAEYNRLLTMRSGGTYIPPARLRALQDEITDKTSKEYQRMAWESLKKSINGLVNKVNISNIKLLAPELFQENLVRGRGLFCRSIMKAQAASIVFTPIYAAMAAIVNTKLPQIGELLVNRLVTQWQKAYKRNDKSVCLSASTFLAQLANQQVVSDLVLARMLTVLLARPTDDSVEVAVGLMKEVGAHMDSMNSKIAEIVYDQFRNILHNGEIDKRTQYMIESLYQIRKDGYKNNPALRDELDIIDEEDQITHMPDLDGKLNIEDGTNIFKFDPEWEASEEAYRKLKADILGEGDDEEVDEEEDDDEDDEEDEDEQAAEEAIEIKDRSNTDLVNLRKTIYLTMTSSLSYEEACHKLMRIALPVGREEELPSMIIECSIEGRTFNKFYGLIAERFCNLNRLWRELFQNQFITRYETIHRQDSNKLRITAQFFGHLLSTDSISWDVFHVIRITEADTTSSSRIFIKILMEELSAAMGKKALVARFKEDELQPALTGLFPMGNDGVTRFSINYFTAIGMGELTEGMREAVKNLPGPVPVAAPASARGRSASVSSYSSYSSRSRSYSRSRSPARRGRDRSYSRDSRRSRSYDSRSPSRSPRRRSRERARSPSDSRSRRHSRDRSRSPSYSRSRSRRRDRSHSYASRSRSREDTRRRRVRSYDSRESRSRSPKRRRIQDSRSRSPSPRRSHDSRSRSPPRRRSREDSRGRRSPSTTSRSPSPRRSRGNARGRRARSFGSSSRSPRYRAESRSRTPPPRGRRSYAAAARPRYRSYSASRSPSPRQVHGRSRRDPIDRYRPRPQLPSPVRRNTSSPKSVVGRRSMTPEDPQAHIHPDRRAQVAPESTNTGRGRGRAQASDYN